MGIKVLWITPCFPIHQEDKHSQYLSDPLSALLALDVEPIALVTQSWRPKWASVFHSDFIVEKIDYSNCLIKIKLCRYLSIPRHYFRLFSNFFYLMRVVPEIKKLAKLHHFDVIHAHGEICGLAAVRASKKLKIPTVVTIHGIDTCPRVWNGLSGKMFRRVLNEANKLIFVGEPLRKHFQPLINHSEHVSIVPNGFRLPTTFNVSQFRTDDHPIRIISVSNLHEGKGIELTLLALAKLQEQGVTNWSYTIIGSGAQQKLCERIIKQHHLKSKIIFKGDCNHDVVYSCLRNADVFCLPSYREAFGIAYVEAMAHGLLTIGVRGQGPEAFITHEKTGLLVKPKDLPSLIKMLKFSITDYQNTRVIAETGKKHVLTHFSWQKHAKELMSIYQGLL